MSEPTSMIIAALVVVALVALADSLLAGIARVARAWRLYTLLQCSWRLAWAKAQASEL